MQSKCRSLRIAVPVWRLSFQWLGYCLAPQEGLDEYLSDSFRYTSQILMSSKFCDFLVCWSPIFMPDNVSGRNYSSAIQSPRQSLHSQLATFLVLSTDMPYRSLKGPNGSLSQFQDQLGTWVKCARIRPVSPDQLVIPVSCFHDFPFCQEKRLRMQGSLKQV